MLCSSAFRKIRQDLSLDGDAQATSAGFLELPRALGNIGDEEGIHRQLGKEQTSARFCHAVWDLDLGFS